MNEEPDLQPSITESNYLAKELTDFLEKKEAQVHNQIHTFTKEVNLFCAGRLQKTQTFNELHQALLTIPPTSVEAERVSSASGLFLTKLRSKLSDHTIDLLVFLKFYFAWLQLEADCSS